MRTFVKGLLAVMVIVQLSFWFGGCSGDDEIMMDRKWLADRCERYLAQYKVGYGKVVEIQAAGTHPCTRGHKAAPAALFHGVLQMLNKAYLDFNQDVQDKLGSKSWEDPPMKTLLSTVRALSKSFATPEDLAACGKLDAGQAKERYYLQDPLETSRSVGRFREKIQL